MLDLSEYTLATIGTWVVVASLLYTVGRDIAPRLWGGAKTTAPSEPQGLLRSFWENRIPIVAVIGLAIVIWLHWGLLSSAQQQIDALQSQLKRANAEKPLDPDAVRAVFDAMPRGSFDLGAPIFFGPSRVIYARFTNGIALWFKPDRLYLLSRYHSNEHKVICERELLPNNDYYKETYVRGALHKGSDVALPLGPIAKLFEDKQEKHYLDWLGSRAFQFEYTPLNQTVWKVVLSGFRRCM